jgi:hypothetical protein
MSKTRLDVVVEALNKLGAVGSDQAPSASDTALVESKLDGVLEELQHRGVIYVGDPGVAGQLDSGAFTDAETLLIALPLAKANGSDFGKVGQDLSDTYSQAADAENRMRAMQDVEDDPDEPIRFRSF